MGSCQRRSGIRGGGGGECNFIIVAAYCTRPLTERLLI